MTDVIRKPQQGDEVRIDGHLPVYVITKVSTYSNLHGGTVNVEIKGAGPKKKRAFFQWRLSWNGHWWYAKSWQKGETPSALPPVSR